MKDLYQWSKRKSEEIREKSIHDDLPNYFISATTYKVLITRRNEILNDKNYICFESFLI